MNIEEIRALSDEEIVKELDGQREEWRNLRFQDALGRLTAFHQLREVRKSIARLLTIQREREIAADPEGHFAATTRIRARRRQEKRDEKVSQRLYERRESRKHKRRRF